MTGENMAKDENELTLEQNIERLEAVIEKLEKGDLPLDKAFEIYKTGMNLLLKCNAGIDKVVNELTVLESEGFNEL